MTAKTYDIPAILALPVAKNDHKAATIGQYIGAAAATALNGGNLSPSARYLWRNPILTALVKAKIIPGVLQKDGSLYSADETHSSAVFEAIGEYLKGADYQNLPVAPVIKEWYIVDFDKSYGSSEITLQEILSGPHTEEEARRIREEEYSTSVYQYSSYVLHIPVPTDLPKKA